MKIHGCWLIALLIIFSAATAESNPQGEAWGVSIGAGWNTYVGDLNPDADGRSFNYTITAYRDLDPRTSIELNFHTGGISGETRPGLIDADHLNQVNSYFSADVNSIDVAANWNYINGNWLEAYAGIGLGIMDYSIHDNQGRNLRERPQTRVEGENYETLIPYAPLKIGFTFFASSQVNLVYERSWNYTNSDYLDNIGLLGDLGSDWILRRKIAIRYHW